MTRFSFAATILAPYLLLAGCAMQSGLYAPVANPIYSAIGHDPFWMLAIGEDRIVLRLGHDGGEQAEEYDDLVYPRTLPRTENGVRTWQTGEGTETLTVEARPGPCAQTDRSYEDHVRVRLSGRELSGCGGRLLGGSPRR
jgi:uncharacterized membrane protein